MDNSPADNAADNSDKKLLADCDVHIYKASGPGGQHRNKVSSAVRLRHRPTGITAVANDSRSQHENRRLAIKRLRMNLALRIRTPVTDTPPEVVAECLFTPTKGKPTASRRLQVGRKDQRFWEVAAHLLDLLDETEGRLAPAAGRLGISTGNLTAMLKSERHLLAAAQKIRKTHGRGAIS